MTNSPQPASPLDAARTRSERLLGNSPRFVERVGALLLSAIAALLLYDFVLHRWFYLRFHQYYRSTPESRLYDWAKAISELVIGLWLIALAVDLMRGVSHRRDHGLFSPAALRIWGVAFVLAPLAVILLVWWQGVLHPQMLLWFWSAAIACFTLAARRERARLHD